MFARQKLKMVSGVGVGVLWGSGGRGVNGTHGTDDIKTL